MGAKHTSFTREEIMDASFDLGDVVRHQLDNVSPGEILKHEFMMPLSISARSLAKALNVPTNRVTEIINRKRAVTADTALRLSKYFGVSAEFWMNLQTSYDLEVARRNWSSAA